MKQNTWRDLPTMSVSSAAEVLGIGRTLAYQLANSGELPGVMHIGNRIVVSTSLLRKALGEI